MKKKNHISDEDFAELKLSLEQALQHARGERHDLRTTVAPTPSDANGWGSLIESLEDLEDTTIARDALTELKARVTIMKKPVGQSGKM
jgi:hypothetical protein